MNALIQFSVLSFLVMNVMVVASYV